MVFQDYALFPHLTVEGQRWLLPAWRVAAERWQGSNRCSLTVGLAGQAKVSTSSPAANSSGVALARALAPRPSWCCSTNRFQTSIGDLRERLSVEVREILGRARA